MKNKVQKKQKENIGHGAETFGNTGIRSTVILFGGFGFERFILRRHKKCLWTVR